MQRTELGPTIHQPNSLPKQLRPRSGQQQHHGNRQILRLGMRPNDVHFDHRLLLTQRMHEIEASERTDCEANELDPASFGVRARESNAASHAFRAVIAIGRSSLTPTRVPAVRARRQFSASLSRARCANTFMGCGPTSSSRLACPLSALRSSAAITSWFSECRILSLRLHGAAARIRNSASPTSRKARPAFIVLQTTRSRASTPLRTLTKRATRFCIVKADSEKSAVLQGIHAQARKLLRPSARFPASPSNYRHESFGERSEEFATRPRLRMRPYRAERRLPGATAIRAQWIRSTP
jgi:hypothetical protein